MTSAPERIDLRRIVPQPWKNGGGLTRELAAAPARDGFEWRISMAEVAQDGPFSVFAGIDRSIVLLDGAGMVLQFASHAHRLSIPFEPFVFSGDETVDARLIDGPTTDFNVMARRGRWRAEVGAPPDDPSAPAAAGLLLCWHGALSVQGTSLPAQHALLWRTGLPALQCRAASAHTRALLVRLLAL